MSPDTRAHRRASRRGGAAVLALLLLAMTAFVVSSTLLASGQQSAAAATSASSVHALFAAEAGRAIAISALAQGADPEVPDALSDGFNVTFTRIDVAPETEDYRIVGRSGRARRAIQIGIHLN